MMFFSKFQNLKGICLGTVMLFLLTSCGSSFSAKDLAACDTAWSSTSNALFSTPKAAYNDYAPAPTYAEISRHYEDLIDLKNELGDLAISVENSDLKLALLDFSRGSQSMASDFLANPLGKGTPGITQFNETFKAVTELCKKSGWEN